jgi:predicted PurR-regulated permease PerM
MNHKEVNDQKFLAWLTFALIVASLWIFKSYLHFLVVAAVLAFATSHLFTALTERFSRMNKKGLIYKNRDIIAALLLSTLFLLMIFVPLIYFVSVTYDQAGSLDLDHIRQTLTEMVDKTRVYLKKIPFIQEPLARLERGGLSLVKGPAIEALADAAKGIVAGAGALLGQIIWIMLFYFLFNAYGRKMLRFVAELVPMSYEHEKYLYRECTGTVAVVFYGTLFNMVVQGIAFGLLMVFVGTYDALYLGALAGFCSVIPIVGAALVYVPVVALELFAGNFINAIIVLLFAWGVMGVLIDNILRLIFISSLKKMFGFEYTMNEILILLAMLAGVASLGFWGLIIGPSILALTFAAANLYSTGIDDKPQKSLEDLQEES